MESSFFHSIVNLGLMFNSPLYELRYSKKDDFGLYFHWVLVICSPLFINYYRYLFNNWTTIG